MMTYRPPQAMRSTRITKIVCSDDKPPPFSASALSTQTSQNASSSNPSSSSGLSSMIQSDSSNSPAVVNFACVSEGGEVFVFGAPGVPPIGAFGGNSGAQDMLDADTSSGSGGSLVMSKLFKPQRVWALKRGLIGAVKDAAIGSDGTLVVCTVSGHVYVRSRSSATSASTNAITSALSGLSISPSEQATIASLSRAPKAGGNIGSGGGGGRSNKFSRIPFLQRVVSVCASSTGAFGAIRIDAVVPDIVHPRLLKEPLSSLDDDKKGWDIAEDLTGIRPWMWKRPIVSPLDKEREDDSDPLSFFTPDVKQSEGEPGVKGDISDESTSVLLDAETKEERDDEDDLNEDEGVDRDVARLTQMCGLLADLADTRRDVESMWGQTLPYGADIMVAVHLTKAGKARGKRAGKLIRNLVRFPAHRLVLGARSKVLCSLLSSFTSIRDGDRSIHVAAASSSLEVTGFHPLTILILLEYLYTDNLVCTWDRRISSTGFDLTGRKSRDSLDDEKVLVGIREALNLNIALGMQVKAELQVLGRLLDLSEMLRAMESVVKRLVVPTLKRDLTHVYREAQNASVNQVVRPDLVFLLAENKEVHLHSIILRARSEYFEAFLGEDLWTKDRWGEDRCLRVDLKHVRWAVVEYVLKWMCCGEVENLFGSLGFADSVDDVLEFLFEVISVANELLLSPLILLTSQMILKFLHTSNACYILSEATHYNIQPLIASVQGYIAADLETFLENKMLEVLAPSIVKQLSVFVRTKQEEKAQFVRGGGNSSGLMEKWKDWLMQEDIPFVIVPSVASRKKVRERRISHANKLSPPSPSIMPSLVRKSRDTGLPDRSPFFKGHSPKEEASGGDDLFDMDGLDIGPPSVPPTSPPQSSPGPVPAWKASSVPRSVLFFLDVEAAHLTQTSRVDMRALLAQEASASQLQRSPIPGRVTPGQVPAESASSSLKRAPGSFQRDTVDSPPRSGGSPWKATPVPARQLPTASGLPSNHPSNVAVSQGSIQSTASPGAPNAPRRPSQQAPSTPPRPPPPPSNQPGLGPVFTPAKIPIPKSASPNIPRRASSSNAQAWAAAPKQQPATVTPGMSFVAIQQLDLEQGATNEKDKRSLVDIQREEQERRQEEEFLRWWQAEEERVRMEAEALRLGEERSRKETVKGGGKKPQRRPKGRAGPGSTKDNNGPAQPGLSGNTSSQGKAGGPKPRKASNTGS
ncbi:hypothetical protein V5O48_000145 [Marasmius crinis-equi]|uniref:BTB domain-containing protein n=1 Tax=Marasmius crinis-equi TaxID=585013 RepID=A0ABR3G278_9AGAR